MGNYKIVATGIVPPNGPAPNIASASCSAYFGMQWNGSAFGVQGTIPLPSTNLGNLKEIDIDAMLADGSHIPVQILYAAFGSTVDFKGPCNLPQSGAIQDVVLTFVCKNSDNAATPSPLQVTVHVRASAVIGFTSAGEVGTRYIDPKDASTRLESMTVGFVPELDGYPQNVSYLLCEDATAATPIYKWCGWQKSNAVGDQIEFGTLVPGANGTWKVAAYTGVQDGSGSSDNLGGLRISEADLVTRFPGVKVSDGFTVNGLALPAADAATNISVMNVPGQSFQAVNKFRADNSQYGEIGPISATDPADNSFYFRTTIEELAADHSSRPGGGGEKPHDGWQVSGGVHHDSGLLFDYSPGLAFIRHRAYLANRNSQGEFDFEDPTTNRLQTGWVGGPANYCDIAVTTLTDASPDVTAYHAGTLDQATNTWTAVMSRDILKTKLLVDYAVAPPINPTGWSGVSIHITTPAGKVVRATDVIRKQDFIDSGSGPVYHGCLAVEGSDIPSTPQSWKFTAVSHDLGGAPNLDTGGLPVGPYQNLSTLVPVDRPITEDGKVNLAAVTGTMPISNISNLGSFNITDFTGNMGIDRITNLGSFNITNFTGNLSVGRIDNLGTFAITNFTGNLPVGRIDNLGTFAITSFTGNLPVGRIDNLGTLAISSFSGSLDIGRVSNLGSINISAFAGSLDVSRVTNLGTLAISSFTGSLDVSKVANLGSFSIGSFEGVITNTQLAAGILADLTKFSAALRPITKVTSLPSPTDPAYPAGTTVLLTTDSTLHKNSGSAWSLVSASDTVTGKIADADILSINCNKFVGQIVAGNVQNIRVDNLVGTLSVAQANSIAIYNLGGNLDMSRVNNLNNLSIANLQGNLDMTRVTNLNNLNIGNLQGSLDIGRVSNIGTLLISALYGNLDVSRVNNIGTISINTFSGTIGTLNATTVILTGQWGDGAISAISCSKLLAGEVNVTGGNITFSGSGGIKMFNGGSLTINPGTLIGTSATFTSMAAGWRITPGWNPGIQGDAGSFIYVQGYIDSPAYRCAGYVGVVAQYVSIQDLSGATHAWTMRGGICCGYSYTP